MRRLLISLAIALLLLPFVAGSEDNLESSITVLNETVDSRIAVRISTLLGQVTPSVSGIATP